MSHTCRADVTAETHSTYHLLLPLATTEVRSVQYKNKKIEILLSSPKIKIPLHDSALSAYDRPPPVYPSCVSLATHALKNKPQLRGEPYLTFPPRIWPLAA